jgi:hypothetical protein
LFEKRSAGEEGVRRGASGVRHEALPSEASGEGGCEAREWCMTHDARLKARLLQFILLLIIILFFKLRSLITDGNNNYF